jgi:tRNA pseudouridine38-40 synthase
VRLKLTLEYDGTPFRGWAAQPGLPTVEAALAAALAQTFSSVEALVVAGRTDSGVHALGNVVSVTVEGGPPPERAAKALSSRLPDEVAVVAAEHVADAFNARFDARSRSYRYRILNRRTRSPFELRRSWWLTHELDVEALGRGAAAILGTRDFRAFTPTGTSHKTFVRTVERAEWIRHGDHVDFEITANAFLRHMVRALVGTTIELGPDAIAPLLDGAPRAEAGKTAPPWGLYLVAVEY